MDNGAQSVVSWWSKHPEVVAVGRCNIPPITIRILATKAFEMNPLPKEWEGFEVIVSIEKNDTAEVAAPLKDSMTKLYEDLEF